MAIENMELMPSCCSKHLHTGTERIKEYKDIKTVSE